MIRIAPLLLLLLSTAALAQTTSTDCQTYSWGQTQCRSTTPQRSQGVNWGNIQRAPNPGQSFSDAYQRGLQERAAREAAGRMAEAAHQQAIAAQAQREAAEASSQAVIAAQSANEVHRQQSLEAAKLVTAGDCAGAQTYALSSGNFVLAQQIKDYCGK